MKKITSYKELKDGIKDGKLSVFTGTKIDLFEFEQSIKEIVSLKKSKFPNQDFINKEIKSRTWKIESLYIQINENCKRNGLNIYSFAILYHELKSNSIDCFNWTFRKLPNEKELFYPNLNF